MSLTALFEGYGRTFAFNYGNWKKDPTPNALLLGHHINEKGTRLFCAINLNALSPTELIQLRIDLPAILKVKNMKRRYWTGRSLKGSAKAFKEAYRTYDKSHMGAVTKGTLTFLYPVQEDYERALEIAQEDEYGITDLEELDEDKRLEYLGKALIDRELGERAEETKEEVPAPKPVPPSWGPPAPPAPPPATPPGAPMPPGTSQGMQPITPADALPPPPPPAPPPPEGEGPEGLGGGVPRPPVKPKPTSPARRRPGAKTLPGREPPQPPPKEHEKPKIPTDLTSPHRPRGGAAGAIAKKRERDFDKATEERKTEEGLGEPPQT